MTTLERIMQQLALGNQVTVWDRREDLHPVLSRSTDIDAITYALDHVEEGDVKITKPADAYGITAIVAVIVLGEE